MCYSGRDPDEVVQRHIKLLHTYNEIKDGAQRLIGAVRGFSLDDTIQSNISPLVLRLPGVRLSRHYAPQESR